MSKKIKAFLLVITLFGVLLVPGLGQAQTGPTVLSSTAEPQFPLSLDFKLSAKSTVNITDIRLQYVVDRDSFAQITSEAYVPFAPASSVNVAWTLDMRRTGGLPPGSRVTYWWLIRDASGQTIETKPSEVQFNDARYQWQSLSRGQVTLYWYEGRQSFAEELMKAVDDALSRLEVDTGARLKKPVELYIYANSQDLQGAMVFPQEWTGGVAYTRYNIIAIGIPTSNLAWGRRAVAHELSHLVTQQVTLNPYNELPTWLNEGLSMYAEGELETPFAGLLKRAIAENSLITPRSLSSPFSANAEESYLAYAESFALVEFLTTKYGRDKMLELLTTFSQGATYDGALQKVYGFDMDGLFNIWREWVVQRYGQTGRTVQEPSGVAAPVPALALAKAW